MASREATRIYFIDAEPRFSDALIYATADAAREMERDGATREVSDALHIITRLSHSLTSAIFRRESERNMRDTP